MMFVCLGIKKLRIINVIGSSAHFSGDSDGTRDVIIEGVRANLAAINRLVAEREQDQGNLRYDSITVRPVQ